MNDLRADEQMAMAEDAREAVVNQLYDLQHDLVKYIRMPLTFLPSHATDTDLRDALERALRQTYRRADEVITAERLWQEFSGEIPPSLLGLASYRKLEKAVARALAWERSIDDHGVRIERASVLADFGAIGAAIDLLIVDVEAGEVQP